MMKYGDLTGRIIGSAMKVHSFLGSGFQEKIYQRALAIEMSTQNLSLEAYKLPVGLLINFGSRSLMYKRVYNTKHPDNKR